MYLIHSRAELEYLVWKTNFFLKKKNLGDGGQKLIFKGIYLFFGTTPSPWLVSPPANIVL